MHDAVKATLLCGVSLGCYWIVDRQFSYFFFLPAFLNFLHLDFLETFFSVTDLVDSVVKPLIAGAFGGPFQPAGGLAAVYKPISSARSGNPCLYKLFTAKPN